MVAPSSAAAAAIAMARSTFVRRAPTVVLTLAVAIRMSLMGRVAPRGQQVYPWGRGRGVKRARSTQPAPAVVRWEGMAAGARLPDMLSTDHPVRYTRAEY